MIDCPPARHASPTPDELARNAAVFAQITRWMAVMSALVAALYVPVYAATRDARILPILSICAAFAATVALVRARFRNLIEAVYTISALIVLGMIGVAASLAGFTGVLPAATGILPALLTVLVIGPRHVSRIMILSTLGAYLVAVVDRSAVWNRFDLAGHPVLWWAITLIVAAMIMVLAMAVFRALDRSLGDARESARQLRLLYDTSRMFAVKTSRDDLLPRVAANLAHILDATDCFIVLCDPSNGEPLPASAYGTQQEAVRRLHIRPDEPSLVRTVFQRQAPVIIEDTAGSRLISPNAAQALSVRAALALPLIHHRQVMGAVIISEARRTRPFRQDEIDRVQGLVQQVAAEIANAQALERERRRITELSILHRISSAISSTLDTEQVCRLVVEEIGTSAGYEHVSLYLLDGQLLRLQAVIGHAEIISEMSIERGMLGKTARSGQPILLADVTSDPDYVAALPEIVSEACAPIRYDQRTFGVLNVETFAPRVLGPDDLDLLVAIAAQVAVTLRNTQLYREARRRHHEMEALHDIERAITALDLDGCLRAVAVSARQLVNASLGHVFLAEPDGLRLRAASGPFESRVGDWRLPWGQGLVGWAASQQQIAHVPDVEADARYHRTIGDTRSEIAVPMQVNDEIIGVLDVQSDTAAAFDQHAVTLLSMLAAEAAIAIHNARLFEAEHRSRQVMETLLDVARALGRTLELDELLHLILDQLQRLIPFVSASIAMLEPGDKRYTLRASHNLPGNLPPDLAFDIETTETARRMIELRRPVRIDDVASFPGWLQIGGTAYIRSWLGVPLISGDQIIGFLMLDHTEAGFFTEEHERWSMAFAQQATMAIENARLLDEARRRAARERVLHTIAITVASSATLGEAMERVVQSVHEALHQTHAVLLLVDREARDLTVGAVAGYDADVSGVRIPIGQGVTGWVAQTGLPALISDVRSDPRFLNPAGLALLRSELAVPLVAGSEVVGVLNVESEQENAFDAADVQLLTTLGGNLAMIIHNLRLLDEVRAANARLQELDRLKSQFLANVSHELRTPLNTIIGFGEVLLDGLPGELNAEQREFVSHIYSSGRHLLTLINEVLDLSKIHAGHLKLNRRPVSPRQSADEARAVVELLVVNKRQQLVIDIEPDLPQVSADEFRLKQILINLLSNAHKFSPDGSRITLAARRDGEDVRFSVIDQGSGIRPDDHERVFQEFVQVEDGPTRSHEGTGLGLPITRRLVELHGGRIWIESEGVPGRGSTFHFTLPQAVPAQPPALPPGAPETRPIVLIVEDDVQFADLLALYFRQEGYRAVHCRAGDAVLATARETRPALITLDLVLPGRDGWSVLHDLKNAPDTRDIPVMVISSLDHSSIEAGRGAVEYLAKPLDRDALLGALRRVEPVWRAPQRVLIVDDDPLVGDLLTAMLPPPEYAVVSAISGPQALAAVQRKRPDVILLDLLMPDMSGYQFLDLLRADPATHDVPVIVVTAKQLTQSEQRRLDGPAQALIRKSELTRQHLIDTLRQLRLPSVAERPVVEVRV